MKPSSPKRRKCVADIAYSYHGSFAGWCRHMIGAFPLSVAEDWSSVLFSAAFSYLFMRKNSSTLLRTISMQTIRAIMSANSILRLDIIT